MKNIRQFCGDVNLRESEMSKEVENGVVGCKKGSSKNWIVRKIKFKINFSTCSTSNTN